MPGDGGGHVGVIVTVLAGHLLDEVLVLVPLDLAVCEEPSDRVRDLGCGLRRALVLPDDHPLPLVEQVVGPDDVVVAVLAQRQAEIHH